MRLGGRWIVYAFCLRAAKREDRRRGDPRSLSGGPAANDLIGGHIDYMCGNIANSVARAAARQSKPLALLSRERTPPMPELATPDEEGIPDYEVATWTAFSLPKGAPQDIVAKLNEATHAASHTPA